MKLQKWMPFRFRRTDLADKPLAMREKGWNDPLATFQNEMNRMFHRFWREPFAEFGALDTWFGDHRPAFFRPIVDVVDEAKMLKVVVELPGMDEKDVELAVEDGMLMIRGEKKLEKEKTEEGLFRIERAFGRFERAVPLPIDVDVEKIDAKFEKGVLTVAIPKPAEAPTPQKRIPIHA